MCISSDRISLVKLFILNDIDSFQISKEAFPLSKHFLTVIFPVIKLAVLLLLLMSLPS